MTSGKRTSPLGRSLTNDLNRVVRTTEMGNQADEVLGRYTGIVWNFFASASNNGRWDNRGLHLGLMMTGELGEV
jgi:hypothetical protein